MTDDRIVTDGGDVVPEARKSVGPWVWLFIGLGLGVGVMFLVGGSSFRPRALSPTTLNSTTTVSEATLGVGDVILGFPDNLSVVVSPGAGRALEVVTWPVQGEATFRSVALSDLNTFGTPRFDSSGHFLAAMVDSGNGLLLTVGRPNSFGIVTDDVNGFAWHDSNAADLAWSKERDGILEIWTSEDAGQPRLVSQSEDISGTIAALGSWGFAVVEQTGVSDGAPTYRSYILDPNGDLSRTIDGRIIASHGSGIFAISEGDRVFVDGPSGELAINTGELESGIALGAAFSPQADRLALTGLLGVVVVDLVEEADAAYPIRAGSDSIAWSSDGRYLLVSSFRGIAVVDTRSGDMFALLEDQTTRAVAVAPIGTP